ncbi:MAG: serine/threonine-protein kinase, partial [Verrucomicrobiota bacterium]|nr:serine/threonine-protein kinase [Verrucomicrobiota bacterium]
MKSAEKITSICTTCGSSIETTEFGCLACLLQLGIEQETPGSSDLEKPDAAPARFGTYIIAQREDGSACELGRGAMGVTYRAIDTTLNREVALKIIQAGIALSDTEARERFMREARAAAGLRHPNVATVYQFGIQEETGQCFCALELIEGETLEERVRRSGPLPVPMVLEIARQITAALGAAEKGGLVHRDLKPANIMVQSEESDGSGTTGLTAKIIDFGVAKALAETPDARLLTQGGFVGTPAFASPEQFAGVSVDGRSDIYSLGVTLWFLLTGEMPFGPGQTSSSLPSRQLKAAHIASSLRALLAAMLATEPAGRPSVQELAKKLAAIQNQLPASRKPRQILAITAAAIALLSAGVWFIFHPLGSARTPANESIPEKSIAVLPLKNLSAEKENAFFADGIQDDLLSALAKVADLKVIARTSVMEYEANAHRDLRE